MYIIREQSQAYAFEPNMRRVSAWIDDNASLLVSSILLCLSPSTYSHDTTQEDNSQKDSPHRRFTNQVELRQCLGTCT